MATMHARIGGVPLYCQCGSTLIQARRSDFGNVPTAECRNPICELVGKVFTAPVVQLEEIIEVARRKMKKKKTCSKCEVEKDIDQFPVRKDRGHKPDSWCSECRRNAVNKRRAKAVQ
jgi:hypothetical protein